MSSADVVFTGVSGGNGTDQGQAAILDKHPDFLPYAMSILKERQQMKLRALAEQKQKDKDWLTLQKEMKPGAVWQYAQDEVMNDLGKAGEELTELRLKGYDPADVYSEAGKDWQMKQQEIKNKVAQAQNTEDIVQKHMGELAKGGYDPDYAAAWFGGLKGKSIAEQHEYALSGSPLRKVISDLDVLDATIPDLYESVLERGNTTTSVKQARPEDYKPVLESYLTTPEGEEHYRQGLEDKKWSTPDEYKDYMVKLWQSKKPGSTKVTKDEPRVASATNKKKDVGVVASYDPSVSKDENGRINVVTIDPSVKAQMLLPDSTPVDVHGIAAEKTPDGKSWIISATTDVEEEVPLTASEQKAQEEGYEITPKTKMVKKEVSFPIDVREGYPGNHNYKTMSEITGQDFQTWLGDQGENPNSSEKTATLKEVRDMLKQHPEYTEQELIEYYQNQGYTIK